MFGYVTASLSELDRPTRRRYGSVYCGICRKIREQTSNLARIALSYDMAFLALLLMSLYEPEEHSGSNACCLHPITRRPWVDNEYISYAADMNVVLAYYNCMDDYLDDGKYAAKLMAGVFAKSLDRIEKTYPRQCEAIRQCMEQLRLLEEENCANPDAPASCFGGLMGEILVYREDLWSETLRQMGMALGRYIYLADAAVDYRRDCKKDRYNPFRAVGGGACYAQWEQYLVLAMGRCTKEFERLPLVQDKNLLDNILYSGIWVEYRGKMGKHGASREEEHGDGSL